MCLSKMLVFKITLYLKILICIDKADKIAPKPLNDNKNVNSIKDRNYLSKLLF